MNIEEQIEDIKAACNLENREAFAYPNKLVSKLAIESLSVIRQLQEQIRVLSTRDEAIGKIGEYTLKEYDSWNVRLAKSDKVIIIKKALFLTKIDKIFNEYDK